MAPGRGKKSSQRKLQRAHLEWAWPLTLLAVLSMFSIFQEFGHTVFWFSLSLPLPFSSVLFNYRVLASSGLIARCLPQGGISLIGRFLRFLFSRRWSMTHSQREPLQRWFLFQMTCWVSSLGWAGERSSPSSICTRMLISEEHLHRFTQGAIKASVRLSKDGFSFQGLFHFFFSCALLRDCLFFPPGSLTHSPSNHITAKVSICHQVITHSLDTKSSIENAHSSAWPKDVVGRVIVLLRVLCGLHSH